MANATAQTKAEVMFHANMSFTRKFKNKLAQALGSEAKAEAFMEGLLGDHIASGYGPEKGTDGYCKIIKSKAGNLRLCVYSK